MNEKKKSDSVKQRIWNCIICRILLIAAAVLAGIYLVLLLLVDPLLNSYLKPKMVSDINRDSSVTLSLGNVSYSFFGSSLETDSITLSYIMGGRKIKIESGEVIVTGIPVINLLFGSDEISLGNVELHNSVIKVIDSAAAASNENPGSSSASSPRLNIDKIIVSGTTVIMENEGSRIDSVFNLSIEVAEFSFPFDNNSAKQLKYTGPVSVKAGKIHSRFLNDGYDLTLTDFEVSTSDSLIGFNNLMYKSYLSTDEYFDRRQYRSDKNDISIDSFSVSGINFSSILNDSTVRLREIYTSGIYLEIMTNKRKPIEPGYRAVLPHEMVKDLTYDLKVDNITVEEGTIVLKELWPYSAEPAFLEFTNVSATVNSINTIEQGEPLRISASALLADAGELTASLTLPLLSDVPNYKIEGQLKSMDASALNSFLEKADLVKIISGRIESVTFSSEASGDVSEANVIPIYNNLEIKQVEKDGGGGIILDAKNFLFNNFIIRKSNPNEEGEIKSGNIKYNLKPIDLIMDYIWLTIRKGLGEVVGF